MSLKEKLSYNLIIQSIGPTLSFLTIFIIAKVGGAEVQGRYASVTAWINLAVVIGTFGFPQGFIYLINKLYVSPKVLFKFTSFYCLVFIVCFNLIVLTLIELNMVSPLVLSTLSQVILISLPVTMLVFHGLLRGIYLTHNQSILFAAFSILPATFLFPFVLTGVILHQYNFHLIYLVSSIPVLITVLILVKPILNSSESSSIKTFPWTALFNHGTNSFLQALFFVLQPIIAYWFINKYIGGELEIGYFNLGLFLIQGFLVPIGMVAPLLFEHWTKNDDQNLIMKFTKFKVFFIELIIGGMLALLLNYFIPLVFGSEYIPSIQVVQILLFITPVIFHVRVLIPAIHSKGYPQYNTIIGLARLLVFICLSYVWILNSSNLLVGLAICWTTSEIIGALLTLRAYNLLPKTK